MTRDRAGSPERYATRRLAGAGLLAAALMTACTAAPPLFPAGTPSAVPGTSVPGTSVPATAAPATAAPATAAPASATAATAVEPAVAAWDLDGDGLATMGGALTFTGVHEFSDDAVVLDGRTSYGATSGSGPLDTTSSFSAAAWVTIAREAEFASVLSQVGNVAAAFFLGTGEGVWSFAMKDLDTNDPGHTIRALAEPPVVDPDTWVHLVGVFDGAAGEIRLFIDGELAAATAFDGPWQAHGPLAVGAAQAHGAPSDFWPGAVAHAAVYQAALTADDIARLHESTRPTTKPPLLTEPSVSVCPSSHGGLCLGPLAAGTYTTRAFKTPLTYTVLDGWANYEDLPGNFLLIPPSGSNDGVDAGISDYIGVYQGVAPISGECEERPESGVALTPDAMGAWYASHPGLVVEGPEPVTIGGLDGVVLDLAVAEGDTGLCDIPGLGVFAPVLIGVGPASLTYVLNETFTMRLYLLTAPTGEVIAIEIDDVPGGDTMESMTQVADDMQFGTDAP